MIYKEEAEFLIQNTEITTEQIFYYHGTPNEPEFEDFFQFYKGLLIEWGPKYDINNARLFFFNNVSPNAYAFTSEGHFVLTFTSGLIVDQIINLFRKTVISEIIAAQYVEIIHDLDNYIHVLMYQQVQHMAFYHEFAHLIQKSASLQNWIQERNEQDSFSFEKHQLEMDADSFAALAMSSHIQQYGLKIFKGELTCNKIEKLIELFSTSIILYLLSFSGADLPIYYEKGTHPHPVIRILNILIIVTDYLNQSPKLQEKGIKLQPITIFKNAISIAELIKKKVSPDQNYDLINIYAENSKDIIAYFKKLREVPTKDFTSAHDAWNKKVKQ